VSVCSTYQQFCSSERTPVENSTAKENHHEFYDCYDSRIHSTHTTDVRVTFLYPFKHCMPLEGVSERSRHGVNHDIYDRKEQLETCSPTKHIPPAPAHEKSSKCAAQPSLTERTSCNRTEKMLRGLCPLLPLGFFGVKGTLRFVTNGGSYALNNCL